MSQATPRSEHSGLYERLRLQLQGERVRGYKVGATNPDAQRMFGISTPFYAYLLESRLFTSGARIHLPAGIAEAMVEAEICYELSSRPASINDVMVNVARIWLAIEVVLPPGGTLEGLSFERLIEANGIHLCLVRSLHSLSPTVEISPDLGVQVFINSRKATEGTPGYVYGHPMNSLRWLLKNTDVALQTEAESFLVTTGSCTAAVPVRRGDTVTAVFGDLGQVAVEIAD